MKAWFSSIGQRITDDLRNWWDAEDGVSYDRFFLTLLAIVLCVGFVMVSSASMPVAERLYHDPLHYATRHLFYLGIGLTCAYVVLNIPIEWWHRTNMVLLVLGLLALLAVLLVGRNVNGSTRWIALGPINIQAAEPAKLFFFVYLSSYLVRKHEEVLEHLKGFLKPLVNSVCFCGVITDATRFRHSHCDVLHQRCVVVFGWSKTMAIFWIDHYRLGSDWCVNCL
ncbi:MAG: FtsW/RodA/SpoVE family cell cycle protein [Rheinheimera sp.]|nr:FtsW/RodA/SpoVE family cell cycle protein [Rheinheimera sp.]